MNRPMKTPPGGHPAGLDSEGICQSISNSDSSPNPAPASRANAVAQEKIELLVDDIGCNVGALISTLNVVLAMRDADDVVGLIYGLRRSKAYWRAISGSAAELSALRQSEESP